ncbi:MAG: hypothetical protein INR64_20125, partial [Caulobacteraceae bacterium]|nr:hypothetical protein [Caulobacter sp.]
MTTFQPTLAATAEASAQRRGPFRPARLASVRERLSGPALARRYRLTDRLVLAAASAAQLGVAHPDAFLGVSLAQALPVAVAAAAAAAALVAAGSYELAPREPPLVAALRVLSATAIGAAALVFGVINILMHVAPIGAFGAM